MGISNRLFLDALLFKGQLLIHLVSSWALFLHIVGLIDLWSTGTEKGGGERSIEFASGDVVHSNKGMSPVLLILLQILSAEHLAE